MYNKLKNIEETVIPYSKEALREICSLLEWKREQLINSEDLFRLLECLAKEGDIIEAFIIRGDIMALKLVPNPEEGHRGWYSAIYVVLPEIRCICIDLCTEVEDRFDGYLWGSGKEDDDIT